VQPQAARLPAEKNVLRLYQLSTKIPWAEVRRGAGKGKNRFRFYGLYADERWSQTAVSFLASMWGDGYWAWLRKASSWRYRSGTEMEFFPMAFPPVHFLGALFIIRTKGGGWKEPQRGAHGNRTAYLRDVDRSHAVNG